MSVLELLKLMGSLSLGEENITEAENSLFLQYLNLAHFELYAETASFNQNLCISETVTKLQDQGSVELTNIPYMVNVVYASTLSSNLTPVSLQQALKDDPTLVKPGTPKNYIVQNKKITVCPYQAAPLPLLVWYIPQASSLEKQNTQDDIPYPVTFHPILADGALYYLFQDQSGFKNPQKSLEAQGRWLSGKKRLFSYLKGANSIRLSTFSNV